jgi:hypothetical protein
VNINKLLKDFPRLLERVEALEKLLASGPRIHTVPGQMTGYHNGVPFTVDDSLVDTGTQVPVTLAPAVSERSPAVNRERSFGEEKTRNRRGSTRRN